MNTRTSMLDVMIVGAHKAGTSALLRYLGGHPGVRAQIRPEMTYFLDPELYGQELHTYGDRYFGVPGQPHDLDRVHVGKLAGLMYDGDGLDRLHGHNPAVEVVAILRDPVRRAYSEFWFARLKGREPLESFEEALHADRARFGDDRDAARLCDYLGSGRYAEHVGRLYQRFDRDKVSVLLLEEFQRDAAGVVAPLLERVGLETGGLPAEAGKRNAARRPRSVRLARLARSRTGGVAVVKKVLPRGVREAALARWRTFNEVGWSPPPMDPGTERELRAYFAGPNDDLGRLLGRDLSVLWPAAKG